MRDIIYVQLKAKELILRNVTQAKIYQDIPLLLIRPHGNRYSVVAYGKKAMSHSMANSETVIVNGFDHPRSIIGDFEAAEKTLDLFLAEVDCRRYRFMPYSPYKVIIHPLENLDGGLTTVEKRALQDMAYRVKARKVIVWEGRVLTDQEILNDSFPQDGKLFPANRK
jgi:rod shape-determining protein MreB and related proteins